MSEEKLPIQVGPYTLVYKLGEGGLANVFLGIKKRKGYAIKVLKKDRLNNQKSIQNFVREARIGSNIKHPFFSKVIDHGKVDDHYFLVMELVYGVNVFDMIQYFQSYGKKIPLPITLYVLKGSCEALRYLHEKTVFQFSDSKLFHGDLSPSNLMINQSGFFKLMDLGSANQESSIKITKNHFGKLQFLPPEFFQGTSPKQSFDVYAMAIIAYQMIYGDLPFKAISKTELVEIIKNDTVPLPDNDEVTPDQEQDKALKRFFLKALHKDPEKRHKNIKEFEKDLFLVRFTEKPIQGFHEASSFLREHFMGDLKKTDQTWNDQISFYNKYLEAQAQQKKPKVEALVLPSDRRKHPRIVVTNSNVHFQLQDQDFRAQVVQLSRGGFLCKWKAQEAPNEGDTIQGNIDFDGKQNMKAEAEVRYTIVQRGFHYVGVEFSNLAEQKAAWIDQLVAKQQSLEEKEERIYQQSGLKNLHIFYPSKKVFHQELTNNIQHQRAMAASPAPFDHNSKVILHLHSLDTFQSGAFYATVVMCSEQSDRKYQLGLQVDVNQETLDYLLSLTET
jgi:serine/threonine-protein kinase